MYDLIFCVHSKRRKKRGLPVVGDKASKDGKKVQGVGKAGDVSGKDRAAAASKLADVKKSQEAENAKSTAAASLEVRTDGAVTGQVDATADDRSFTFLPLLFVAFYASYK